MADFTDEDLSGSTFTRVDLTGSGTPGFPPGVAYPVARCLGAVLREEFLHRTFAQRDLAVLEGHAAHDPAGP